MGKPPTPSEGRGSGIRIRELRSEARTLSLEDFEGRHGSAFLLLTEADLSVPKGPATTEVHLMSLDGKHAASTANLALVAFPVRRTGRSVGHLITVGRAANNDISIPDLSISRFHAFLKEDAGSGGWQIQDAGSTNGTTVNGHPVAQQGHGPASSLKAGDNLRLGQVELTFLGVKELREFLLKLDR